MRSKMLSIIIPMYNEEESLPFLYDRLSKLANKIEDYEIEFLFVNDGSKDRSLEMVKEYKQKDDRVCYLNLSRNFGKEVAMGAAFDYVSGDAVVIIDADLQDDIEVIDKFIEEYYKGNDVVYGVRSSRKTDTFFKRATALGFYRFMSSLGVEVIYNHADYRLMSRIALEGLSEFKEVNLFLRGIVPLIGYRYSVVEYERFAGESKYPFKKMLAFAWDGITSFSIKPIRIITGLGFLIFILSLIALIYSLIVKFIGNTKDGWASLTISIWMIGGIQLLSLGVIGEYIGKIYNETKQRPRFIIANKLINTEERVK